MVQQASDRIFTAALVVIGNEVLSGRVQDANTRFLATELKALGVRLREVRVVPDVTAAIVGAVNELRDRNDYVFTTGGIGPTHDDITAQAVADAFGVALERHPEAERLLHDFYGQDINDARLRMANVPAGGELLDNPVSRAPGFQIGNVFVLPGVPRIMQAMFEGFRHRLAGGARQLSRTVTGAVPESYAAQGLADIQARFPEVELGSYPHLRNRRFGTALVVRSTDPELLDTVTREVADLVRSLGEEPELSEGET